MALLFGERTFLCKFDRGHYEEHFCKIILNWDQTFRRKWLLKIFLIQGSGGPFDQWSGIICGIWLEGIMRITSVKLF